MEEQVLIIVLAYSMNLPLAFISLSPSLSLDSRSMSPSIQETVRRCQEAAQAIDSIVDQLKDLPLSNREAQSETSAIAHYIKKALVIGLTLLGLQNRLTTSLHEVTRKLFSLLKSTAQYAELADCKLQKVAKKLSYPKILNKHSEILFRELLKVGDYLEKCALKVDTIVEMARLPTRTRTAHALKALIGERRFVLTSYSTEDLREAMMVFALTEMLQQQIVQESTPKLALISPSASSSKSSVTSPTPSKAERAGFISRVQTSKREPNWKLATEKPCEATLASPSSLASSIDASDVVWPLVDGLEPIEPFPSPDSLHHSLSSASISVEEVYDSYHDHAEDATLGLAGVDAVAALRKQPSHRAKGIKRSVQKPQMTSSNVKSYKTLSKSSDTSTIHLPRPRAFSNASQNTVARVMSQRSRAFGSQPLVHHEIRDQYY